MKCLKMIYNENKAVSRSEYASLFKTSTRTAVRDLRQLLRENLVKEKGKGRSLRYTKP